MAPHSHDDVIKNVLASFPTTLRERQYASCDVAIQAATAFRVCCVTCLFLFASHSFQRAAADEGNSAFEEARQSFLQTCANVVFETEMDSEPLVPTVNLLSARILHGHARIFRSCLPYAESHRANSLVFCLLRRLNAYNISLALSSSGDVDDMGSTSGNSGLSSVLNDSDYACLRSIIIAATMKLEPESALNELTLQGPSQSPGHSPQLLPGTLLIDAPSSYSDLSPTEHFGKVSKSSLHASSRPSSAMEGLLMTSVPMNGTHLLTCNSHIVATLVATILPINSHASCLTAAMLVLHVVAAFCPHLFKPPSMSQPLGMIELANRTIMAVISCGSYDAICQRLAPLTGALPDDHKLLFRNLISHTMQFVCDIFLMRMVRICNPLFFCFIFFRPPFFCV